MRIGLLTQYYLPEIGASQTRLSALTERLVARGHEVVVLTGMPNYPTGHFYPGYRGVYRREVVNGVRVIRTWVYPTKRLGAARLFSFFSFLFCSTIVGLVKLPRLDYLITDSPPVFLGFGGYLLSRAKRARLVFNVADLWLDSALTLGIARQGLALSVARHLESLVYRKAWLVTGQSKEIVDCIRQRHPDVRTHHMSNGVMSDVFTPDKRDQGTRRELAAGRSVLAVFAGLHGHAQGLTQVLQAAERLRDLDGVGFVFVGDGPEKEALIAQSAEFQLDNVFFHDPVPLSEVPSILASSDLAIVPLVGHILGQVPAKIYEAMGAGIPVLLVAAGEAATIVTQCGAGVVVAPGDIDGIVAAVRGLAGDAMARDTMGRAGRRAAVEQYDRYKIVDGLAEVLEESL